jgi:hypothetical protein
LTIPTPADASPAPADAPSSPPATLAAGHLAGAQDDAAPPPQPSPRAALVGELAAHVARLVAAGDLDGARVAADTMQKLLCEDGEGATEGRR